MIKTLVPAIMSTSSGTVMVAIQVKGKVKVNVNSDIEELHFVGSGCRV